METEFVHILRTCSADMTSHGGFVWPESGPACCDDWDPEPRCGGGLHGLLRGEGNGYLLDWSYNARWLVVRVATADIVELDGKVKFPRGEVIHCGDRKSATDIMQELHPEARAIVGAFVTSGDGGTSTSGYGGTSTSGEYGTSTSGNDGTSTSGDGGTSTSGDGGTSTSGKYGTSTSGDGGTSTSGEYGTSTSGDGGKSTSGDGGTLRIEYYDSKAGRRRTAIAYVGEDGIEANVAYRLNDKHEFVRADNG